MRYEACANITHPVSPFARGRVIRIPPPAGKHTGMDGSTGSVCATSEPSSCIASDWTNG